MAAAANKNPSETTHEPWLYARDDVAEAKYGKYDAEKCGKWMLFFDRTELDAKWAEACELFYGGRLEGVHSMKVSTAFRNPRASDGDTGVVIFYCGPCDDEQVVTKYGKNLLAEVPYKVKRGPPFIYYKSDRQTEAGTRATGQQRNYIYRLHC